jgi:ketol-acid reductoisomerase
MDANTFTSPHFGKYLQQLDLPDGSETVLVGKNRDFTLLRKPFEGIKELLVMGYSSQGPAHAKNLRDSFKAGGVDTVVRVALRAGSETRKRAEQEGFTVKDGTLVTPEEGLKQADMALMLISDAAMAEYGQGFLKLMKPGAVVGLAHGFYMGFLQNRGQKIRDDLTVVGVCPKGMGPSVRRLYEQGSGINASAAWDDNDERGKDLALAWAYGIGAPFTFRTTLDRERLSDLVGERAILLGAVHGIVEAAYLHKRAEGAEPEEAYLASVESLVRGISNTISEDGLAGVYQALSDADKAVFTETYNASYPGMHAITEKIYRDVKSGREVDEVYEDGVNDMPMSNVAGTDMWEVGGKVRAAKGERLAKYADIDATVAGIYVAGMMAQIDVLRARSHYWSEIVNESVIEAIDSLNPFMRARGVDFMIDNCSITARRGARKWAPLYQAWLMQEVFPSLGGKKANTSAAFEDFLTHDAHKAFSTLSKLRPTESIAVE